MRRADASDPLEWVALAVLFTGGVAPSVVLADGVVESALVGIATAAAVWAAIALAVGPRHLFSALSRRVKRSHPQ